MTDKITVAELQAMKPAGRKIVMVTCYDYTCARIADKAGVDAVLVGDSLGMTMLGYENTLAVTMEDMITYTKSVVRGAKRPFIIADMPFMSYQTSTEEAVRNAGRLIKGTGAHCVKLEGGAAVADRIRAITECGIPVCAHIGMTPQSVNAFGGFKVQGKGEANAERILRDALAVQEAGAFMVVLECIPPKLAALITSKLAVLTVGIGAGPSCDGQVLVMQDLLGMNDGFAPKIMRRFADAGSVMEKGFADYAAAVRSGAFPTVENSFPKSDCSDDFLRTLAEKIAD